jgi:aldehyde dehydrogenase (NAD+)
MSGQPLLAVENLMRHYQEPSRSFLRRAKRIEALNDVSFDVDAGRCFGIFGDSGAGKSTLARAIMALETPDGGRIRLMGKDLFALPANDRKALGRHVQMVFQDAFAAFEPSALVLDVVAEPQDQLEPLPARERQALAAEMMEMVGLKPSHLDMRIRTFSGGQRQRIALARALATRPAMIVADEPVAALDKDSRGEIIALMKRLNAELGITFLVISHDPAVIRSLADEVAVMAAGRIVEQGPVAEIFARPQHPVTRRLLEEFGEDVTADDAAAPADSRPEAAEETPDADDVPKEEETDGGFRLSPKSAPLFSGNGKAGMPRPAPAPAAAEHDDTEDDAPAVPPASLPPGEPEIPTLDIELFDDEDEAGDVDQAPGSAAVEDDAAAPPEPSSPPRHPGTEPARATRLTEETDAGPAAKLPPIRPLAIPQPPPTASAAIERHARVRPPEDIAQPSAEAPAPPPADDAPRTTPSVETAPVTRPGADGAAPEQGDRSGGDDEAEDRPAPGAIAETNGALSAEVREVPMPRPSGPPPLAPEDGTRAPSPLPGRAAPERGRDRALPEDPRERPAAAAKDLPAEEHSQLDTGADDAAPDQTAPGLDEPPVPDWAEASDSIEEVPVTREDADRRLRSGAPRDGAAPAMWPALGPSAIEGQEPPKAGAPLTGRILIDGAWIDAAGGDRIDVIDPSEGEVFAAIARGREADVDLAVQAARRSLDGPWAAFPPAARGRFLARLAGLIRRAEDDLALLESQDIGKPLSRARTDAKALARDLDYYAGAADKLPEEAPPADPGCTAWLLREPLGVTGHVMPWNDPMQVIGASIGPALAMGNAVVLKPGEDASLTALAIGALALEAGLPPGVLNVVTGLDREAGSALASHSGIDHLTFAGAIEAGRLAQQAAATHGCPVTMMLAARSVQLVFTDADLDRFVPAIVDSLTRRAGQRAAAGSRLLIEAGAYDEVCARLSARFENLDVGPAAQDLDCGPLINRRQLRRVESCFLRAANDRIGVLAAGQIIPTAPEGGFFVPPTLLGEVPADHPLTRSTLPGPILTATRFGMEDDALAIANAVARPSSVALWTRDGGRQMRLARALRASRITINAAEDQRSTVGQEPGLAALRALSRVKTVTARHG